MAGLYEMLVSDVEPAPTSAKNILRARKGVLRGFNIATGVTHGLVFLAQLIIAIVYMGDLYETELTAEFNVYNATSRLSSNGTTQRPFNAGPYVVIDESLGFYPIGWTVCAVAGLVAIIRCVTGFVAPVSARHARWVLTEGRNPIRWLELAVTAPIYTWITMQIAGVTDIFLLAAVGVGYSVIYAGLGYLMEQSNTRKDGKVRSKVSWSPLLLGLIVYAVQWAVILAHAGKLLVSERTAAHVPFYLYSIPIGMPVLGALFFLVLVIRYGTETRLTSPYVAELAFIVVTALNSVYLAVNFMIAAGLRITG